MRTDYLYFLIILLAVAVFEGCSKDDPENNPPDDSKGYSTGVFIINEGHFPSGTGSITYLGRYGQGSVEKVYQLANNGAVLGNIVQSMNYNHLVSENAFIAVNNANKIEVVEMESFKRVQSIENITSPRYIEFGENGKAYVSCWDNTVKIFSTEGLEFFGQVGTGEGPEKLLKIGNTIWALNQGGFSVDSTVTVISTETDEVVHTLQVYPKPSGIRLDENGFVWVLCSGKGWNGFPALNDSEGHLICIDPVSYAIVKDFPFPGTSEHPEDLVINKEKDQLFYNFVDGIYRFDIHGVELEDNPFIARETMFYAIGLDPVENFMYASDPLDYMQNGMVYRYDAGNGNPVDSLTAGIIPGEFFFAPQVKQE